MTLHYKYAGRAAIATGIALLLEFSFFMISGFSPDKLANPSAAIALLQDKETVLRIATFFGFSGALMRILYMTGLAARLKEATPNRAAAVLYFGILGTIGHGLVALCFYLGFPTLTELASHSMSAAINSWGAFQAITNGFLGLGNLLLGLTLLIAGSAIVAKGQFPKALGVLGLIGGSAAIVSVVITATPLSAGGYMLYMLSVIISMVFDVWVGIQLIKSQKTLKAVA